MKLRFRYNHWYLKYIATGYVGMVFYPWVIFKKSKEEVSDVLFRHEMEHVYQIREIGWVKYYTKWWWYTLTKGYKNNPYEVEAKAHQNNTFTKVERELKDNS